MNRDDVIAMAKEAGRWAGEEFHRRWLAGDGCACQDIRDEKFAALVAAAEREACAQVCEGFKQGNSATYIDDDWADMCAAAIRARGRKEEQPATVADNERDHAEEDASIAAGRLQAGIAGRVV